LSLSPRVSFFIILPVFFYLAGREREREKDY